MVNLTRALALDHAAQGVRVIRIEARAGGVGQLAGAQLVAVGAWVRREIYVFVIVWIFCFIRGLG